MESTLTVLSNEMADAVATAASAVVQVEGHRRPASGVVHSPDTVVTTARAIGGGDHLQVRRHDGVSLDALLVGWDPTTGLAVLRVMGLNIEPIQVATHAARVGQIALAVARSWSNAVTASAGIVSVIGGPLPTGRRRAIEQVIRTTAPMHDGFAGGAFLDASGRFLGITTASSIRGLSVVIPSDIAWRVAAKLVEHGRLERGYLGLAGQPVELAAGQHLADGRQTALLVVAVTPEGPAATAGILVGDLVLDFDGQAVSGPEDLLDLLEGERVGRTVSVQVLRGTDRRRLDVTLGVRPSH